MALSLGMHGLVLRSALMAPSTSFAGHPGGSVIMARLVTLPSPPAPQPPASPKRHEATATDADAVKAALASESVPPKVEDAVANDADVAPPSVVDESAGEPAKAGVDADAAGDYLPSSVLTRGPEPTKPVMLDFPKPWSAVGRFGAKFALYVDESGVVQRVERVDTPDFPPPLEAVVRRTFMGVLFRPGELHGRPVRTRMLIEVSFDAASRSAQQ